MRSIDTLMAEGKGHGFYGEVGVRRNNHRREPHQISIDTTPQVVKLLDQLAASGLYPPTREATAEEILRTALRKIELQRAP